MAVVGRAVVQGLCHVRGASVSVPQGRLTVAVVASTSSRIQITVVVVERPVQLVRSAPTERVVSCVLVVGSSVETFAWIHVQISSTVVVATKPVAVGRRLVSQDSVSVLLARGIVTAIVSISSRTQKTVVAVERPVPLEKSVTLERVSLL